MKKSHSRDIITFKRKIFPQKKKKKEEEVSFEHFRARRLAMDEGGPSCALPELKELESKLGRKIPESLARSLAGGKHDKAARPAVTPRPGRESADFDRLEGKMLFLKQEMANLRAIDVQLMQQLIAINEGIESIRWAIDDRGDAASRDGSLTGSLYSLSDSRDGGSPPGSLGSLNDGDSDELDTLSVGSYLDTLAEDLLEDPSPTDLDYFVEQSVIDGDTFVKSPVKVRVDSDEYYCFG
ncbi:leucine rich adaptor protein 1-like [Syngnathoides biaculeatus]|uniref:leucine rich adaptor protein 1-like n=1 Tax=Syngnathoides biaculeatus TaxID=300417 RepID=UPI002ADE5384|nr:leucine rich adaptor protein 1-like [Syngnathoides biaculeatus]